MWPRVIATENEYGLMARKGGRLCEPLSIPTDCDEFLKCAPSGLYPDCFIFPSSNALLLNGSRFYIDTGQHPEYAAPEGLGPHEAALNELAGGRILEGTVANANELWKRDSISLRCFKNNLSADAIDLGWIGLGWPSSWKSYGNHENYLVLRSIIHEGGGIFEKIGSILYPYFASRYAFSGNGWVCLSGDRLVYLISQRALTISELLAGATTNSRSIINTRDEPHADRGKYIRLHVICGDSLFLEPALLWKLGSLDILLDAIEEGFLRKCPLGEWSRKDVIDSIRVFVKDPTLKAVVCAGGTYNNAISIQKCFRDIAWKFCEVSGHIDDKRRQILELWNTFIKCAQSQEPSEALSPYVDWAAERSLIERDMEKRGYGWDSNYLDIVRVPGKEKGRSVFHHLKELELCFQEEKASGIARSLTLRGIAERIFTEEEIRNVVMMPRPTTRSYGRALRRIKFREFALKNGCVLRFHSLEWTYDKVKTADGKTVVYDNSSDEDKILDPFDIDPHLPKNL